jgi:hypothetical protein
MTHLRSEIATCRVALIGAFLALMLSAQGAAAAPFDVQFANRKVTVSGLPPGARVVFFAVLRIPQRYNFRVSRWQQVEADDDRDGVVTFLAAADIPASSIWAIVDLRTGEGVLTAPGEPGVKEISSNRGRLSERGDRFTFYGSQLDLLYVQPGGGVWSWHATDGTNGLTTVDVLKAMPVAGSGALKALSPGGKLIAINYNTLEAFIVDPAVVPGGGR